MRIEIEESFVRIDMGNEIRLYTREKL